MSHLLNNKICSKRYLTDALFIDLIEGFEVDRSFALSQVTQLKNTTIVHIFLLLSTLVNFASCQRLLCGLLFFVIALSPR